MAVTHTDLTPGHRCSNLGSKTGVFLTVLSILCGLCSFILCLIAETTRSTVTWVLSSTDDRGERYECIYNASGKIPLLCALGAFVTLAIAMVMQHAYMLVAISEATPPELISWNLEDSSSAKAITCRVGFFFVATWVCFAVGEVLLMMGIGVESGHLRKWSRPRPSCLVARLGLFLAAGLFGLTTVFLASGLYLSALRAQRLRQEEESVRREVLEASNLYASPPRSPPHRMVANVAENPRTRQEHDDRHQRRDPAPSLNKSMS